MLSRAKHKVQSQRGASLSMALMLALVVTTVTAVALTAATAVSGRYSQLADMDRSYYNTTSAAKLFWDKMGGNEGSVSVKFRRGCDATEAGGEWQIVDGTQTLSIDDSTDFQIDVDSEANVKIDLSSSNATLFQIVAADMLFSSNTTVSPREYECIIDREKIKNSIDFNELLPVEPLYMRSANKVVYDPFRIGPPENGGGGGSSQSSDPIRPLNVTLECGDDGLCRFVFQEPDQQNRTFEDATPFRCTLSAEMSVDDEGPYTTELDDHTQHIDWVTTVTWKVVGLATGGGTYA